MIASTLPPTGLPASRLFAKPASVAVAERPSSAFLIRHPTAGLAGQ